MEKYSTSILWSDEDEGYIATIPELEGLSAFGETQAEALKELEAAKKAYLDVFEEDDCELPEPDVLTNFSGQFRLRLPKFKHAQLSRKAERENVSLNTLIVSLLSQKENNEALVAILKEGFDGLKEEILELKEEIKRLHVLTDYLYQKEVSASCDIYDPNHSSVFANSNQNALAFIVSMNSK